VKKDNSIKKGKKMKTTPLFFVVLAAITAVSAFGQDRSYQKDFAVNPSARFLLDSYKGTITIRTDGGMTIRAKARIHPDENDDSESVNNVEIVEHESRDSVSIEVRNKPGMPKLFSNNSGMPLVDWVITLPDTVDLVLKTYKSNVSLNVPSGRVDINSYKGTGTIHGVRNKLKLETYKGSFHVEIKKLGDLDLDTYKGEISLEIYGAKDFRLCGSSYKGDFRFSGLAIPVEKKHRNIEVNFATGTSKNRIDLNTYKGAFNLDFR
jgi:hypothetical protein